MLRLMTRLGTGLILALLIPACGDTARPKMPAVAPVISDFRLMSSWTWLNFGGGSTDIGGSLMFEDPNGDVNTLSLKIVDMWGTTLLSTTTPIEGASGLTSGVITGSAHISTTSMGIFTVSVLVGDSRYLTSNELSATFRVIPMPWVERTPMPTPRSGCSVVAVGGLIYVLGGYFYGTGYPGIPSTVVEIYNPANDTWTAGVPLPFFRENLMGGAVSGIIHMVETSFVPGKPAPAHLAFDPASGQWSSCASIPLPDSPAVAGLQGRLHVIGGGNPGEGGSKNVHVYEPTTDTWSLGTPIPFDTYSFATSTADKILTLNLIYDVESDTWSFMASHPSTPRDPGKVGWVAVGNQCFLIGGTLYGSAIVDVDAYDISTGSWHGKVPLPHPVTQVGAVAVNGKVYEFGVRNTLEYTPGNDPY